MIPNSDFFMSVLQNKAVVIQSLIKDIETCQKNGEAFKKLEELYEQGVEVNPVKAAKAFAKANRHSNEVIQKLLCLILIYTSSSSIDGDTATVLNKLGRGEEALQEMMRKKMSGK